MNERLLRNHCNDPEASHYLAWGKARGDIWTHSSNGLSESDFVPAAKIDRIR